MKFSLNTKGYKEINSDGFGNNCELLHEERKINITDNSCKKEFALIITETGIQTELELTKYLHI